MKTTTTQYQGLRSRWLRLLAAVLVGWVILPAQAQRSDFFAPRSAHAAPAGTAADVIDLTFAGRGDATTAESVTVTNLSNPDVQPVTLSGDATLRLVDKAAAMQRADVNRDTQVGIGDIVAVTNVMAGSDADAALRSASDVNGDGTVGIGDIVAITNVMAGNYGSASAGANVVTMAFSKGDILRFEGRSGQMRTIMHLSPESSHDVFFDFFRCQDAEGYNYPIVRIGDMLWMLEDLRPLSIPNLIKTSKPGIWQEITFSDSAVFVANDHAYYTVNGARKAMPEGWQMPSIDEMYAFVKDLQADTLLLGDFLKDRSYEWDRMLLEGLDTLHLQLRPNGYVDQNGTLMKYETMGAWLTRNTIHRGSPVSFEISALNSRLSPMVIHDKCCGFTVRGCRMAPSVYNEMLKERFKSQEAASSSRRKLPMQKVHDNGPLGEYYTYGADRKSVFFDYTSNHKGGGVEQRSGVLFKYNNVNANDWTFESKNLVPKDVNGNDPERILRKVASQGNAEGYENVVYASWSKPFRVFFDGKTKGSIPEQSLIMGEGVVNISIFGDSIRNHAILDGYATRPLLDKDGNTYQWTMPTFNGKDKLKWYIYHGVDASDLFLGDLRREYFARAFNLKCIQDQTGDGVEEIVMNVGNKIAMFDGVTLRCLYERVFADEGSYIGTPNLRYDVADVNGDGYEDIVMVVNTSIDLSYLYVYSQGRLDEEPIFTKALGAKCLFCDVKVGNMSNSDLPEIAILTRGLRNGSNVQLEKQGYLYVSRLYYDNDLNLKETIILPKTSVDAFAHNDESCHHVGNMDLVFGYFRGRNYTQDLVVGDGLWRWDETSAKPTYRFQILSATKDYHEYTIAADAIAAVQTRDGDIEVLTFIWNRPISNTWENGCQVTQSQFGERWLSDGNTAVSRHDFATTKFGWGNVGPIYDDKNFETTAFYNMSSGNEINSHPVLCKFADRDIAKRFKFIKYEVAFSEPRIYAAIAASPYYEDLPSMQGAETTWGKTSSTTDRTLKSDTWGGSVIAGFEHSFSMPFFSSAGVSVEFTAKVSASASIATEHEETISYGQSYSTTTEHGVVMQATPYDVYTYEIIGTDDPDEMGTEFVVAMPRQRTFIALGLQDYVRLTADQKGVGRPQDFLTSTPGQPFTYPTNYDNAPRIIRDDDKFPFLKGKALNSADDNATAEPGGIKSTRSISLSSSGTNTTSVEIGVETELVTTAGGTKVGVGFNYGHTMEKSHTIGQELSVEGQVIGMPSGVDSQQYPSFRWNVVWYYVKDANGEIYPVVNYIVTR